MMSVEIVVPDEFVGDVVADVSARRGMLQHVDSRDGAQVISAEVVLARILGYAADLRRITEGRATHTMEFKTYVEADPLPDPDGNEPTSMALRVA
jgi:elongation factor G